MLAIALALGVQIVAVVSFAILRDGHNIADGIGHSLGAGAVPAVALMMIAATVIGVRKMPATTPVSMIALMAIAGNAAGAAGLHVVLYLIGRYGHAPG